MKFLSIDSKFIAFLTRVADLMILNMIYILCCIPIFTIGAATTALYTVVFRLGTVREAGVVKPFFAAFRSNFKQATILWMIFLPIAALLMFNIGFTSNMENWIHYLFIFFALLLAGVLFAGAYAFPLLSQFENSTKQLVHNAVLLSLGYFPKTILITAINVLPVVLMMRMPLLFLNLWVVWFAFYASVSAYLNTKLFRKIFAPFMPEQGEEA